MKNPIVAKKRFSQNFLVDDAVIYQIIKLISPQLHERIIEIGPGMGALTFPLLENLSSLEVIEIDRDVLSFLRAKNIANLTIYDADALKFDYSKIPSKIRVVGNLPYNISTPLLFHLSKFDNIIDMHFMLQKEVVNRICALPNSHEYGRLSVMLQYRFNCYSVLDVSADAFNPKPKVESAIIRIKPKALDQWQMVDTHKLNQVVTLAFNQRRKTINNSLKKLITVEQLSQLEIDPKLRAENLTVAQYIELSKLID